MQEGDLVSPPLLLVVVVMVWGVGGVLGLALLLLALLLVVLGRVDMVVVLGLCLVAVVPVMGEGGEGLPWQREWRGCRGSGWGSVCGSSARACSPPRWPPCRICSRQEVRSGANTFHPFEKGFTVPRFHIAICVRGVWLIWGLPCPRPILVSFLFSSLIFPGDTHATLYTGSKAMHAHVLRILTDSPGTAGGAAEYGSGAGKKGAAATAALSASNMAITLQRRFLNLVWDSTRQRQLEIFLGLRIHRHLPTLPLPACRAPLASLSQPPGAFLLKPVPGLFAELEGADALLRPAPAQQQLVWVRANSWFRGLPGCFPSV